METAVALMMFCACCYCSIKTRFVQFRRLPQALGCAVDFKKTQGGVSPFSAMATSLAATIGTGNISGVAGAILLGGPGAVFWMWASALVGMAAKYADIYFGRRFGTRSCIGPMAYMSRGLPKSGRFLAGIYAVCCMLACLCMGNLVQINSMSEAMQAALNAFAFPAADSIWPRLGLGMLCAGVVAVVQLGGAKRVGNVASLLVPFMSIAYIVGALAVILHNRAALPGALAAILGGALKPRAFLVGIARGTFTHEAGLGTAAIAHAAAENNDSHRQALYGVFEVFFDTIVICTLTALAVLTSGVGIQAGVGTKNSALVIEAFASVMGMRTASLVVTVSLALFAFSSVLSFCYYGSVCAKYIGGHVGDRVYPYVFIVLLAAGSVLKVSLVWQLAEWMNMAMAVVNMTALVMLFRLYGPAKKRSRAGSVFPQRDRERQPRKYPANC